ncbi:unnamed protein product [Camellia sinensis]
MIVSFSLSLKTLEDDHEEQEAIAATQALSARTVSGTFHDGDLLLNMKGLRLVTEESESRPSESNELDLLFSLEGLETIKVVRKGSGGVVQLGRHKWVGTLFTLKISVRSSNLNLFTWEAMKSTPMSSIFFPMCLALLAR